MMHHGLEQHHQHQAHGHQMAHHRKPHHHVAHHEHHQHHGYGYGYGYKPHKPHHAHEARHEQQHFRSAVDSYAPAPVVHHATAKCGANVLVGCAPEVAKVPCIPLSKGY
ncbi:AAEL017501-PA [Aedes aegypti]|nr:AAEL017501-PA [Aedes aegypti]